MHFVLCAVWVHFNLCCHSLHNLLIDRSDIVNMKDIFLNTPLHEACNYGCVTIVKELLDQGADVVAQNSSNETPLHTACRQGFVEIVKEILGRANTNKDCLDQQRRSLLHYAARADQAEMIELLISK